MDLSPHSPAVPNQPLYSSRLELAALPDAPSWARRHTREVLGAWGVQGEPLEHTELAVSELVTNAVQHAGPAGSSESVLMPYPALMGMQLVVLSLRHMRTHLLVEVFDTDDRPPLAPGAVTWDAEGGRGLFLVEQVAKQWGFYMPPTGGKVVWCEVALNPS